MLKTVRSTVNVDQITGVLPVVNGGTGVTTSTGTGSVVLSAAPTLSGNVGLSTGNIVPATAAKGINFTANTPAAGMTSQLLNWYEEGTFTPEFISTGATFAYAEQYGSYIRVGKLVTLQLRLRTSSASGTLTNPVYVSGLPFSSANLNANNAAAGAIGLCDVAGGLSILIGNNDSVISVWNFGTITQALASTIDAKFFAVSISYRCA